MTGFADQKMELYILAGFGAVLTTCSSFTQSCISLLYSAPLLTQSWHTSVSTLKYGTQERQAMQSYPSKYGFYGGQSAICGYFALVASLFSCSSAIEMPL